MPSSHDPLPCRVPCPECGEDGGFSGDDYVTLDRTRAAFTACPTCSGRGYLTPSTLPTLALPTLVELHASGSLDDSAFAALVVLQACELEMDPTHTHPRAWSAVPAPVRARVEASIDSRFADTYRAAAE